MSADAIKFRTQDKRYGLSLDDAIMTKMLTLCKETANVETGGILVGYYTNNHEWAIVSDVSGPPIGSKRAFSSFVRGIKGLQQWLNDMWDSTNRHYYLGEWHYHPFATPAASYVDVKQIKEHAENGPLNCPEPIMLIVGGNPNNLFDMRAYIYPKGERLYEMEKLGYILNSRGKKASY